MNLGQFAAAGSLPGVPTIGTATAGNTQATVAFTAPTYTGKGGVVTYRAVSSPGSIEGTSTSSPITVTGLSNGTAYTFTVRAETSYGTVSAYSSASNSVTPVVPPVTPPVTPCTGCGGCTAVSGCPGKSGACFLYRCYDSCGNSCAEYCDGPNCGP